MKLLTPLILGIIIILFISGCGEDEPAEVFIPVEQPVIQQPVVQEPDLMLKEQCEEACLMVIQNIPRLDQYVEYECSDEGFCTVTLDKSTIAKKKYSDRISLANFNLIVRTEIDTPFMKGGIIKFDFILDSFDESLNRNLKIRRVTLIESSQLLGEILQDVDLKELDSSYSDQFSVTYETKEMAEERYVILEIAYSYDAVEIDYDSEGNPVENLKPVRESAQYSLPEPLLVLNPTYETKNMKLVT